jgi:ABC-type multidrug transport system ATPase subunit
VVSIAGSTSPSGGGPAGTAVPEEPTIGFDPEARHRFWDLIRRLRDDGTILLTTHYLEEAEALADRVAMIVHGRVVANSGHRPPEPNIGAAVRSGDECSPRRVGSKRRQRDQTKRALPAPFPVTARN